jgi:anti-sigma B factor antagonist
LVRLGIAESDGRCWVTLEGELDRNTTRWFRHHLVALGQRGCREVLVDLGQTTFIDSAGLNLLIGAMEGMGDLGGKLVLRAPSADVYELGRTRRLGELMAMVDDAVEEAEAIDRLSRLFASADLQGPSPDAQTWIFYEPDAPEASEGSSPEGGAGRGG